MSETMTKERPILFSGEMVRAILDGRKTQTRRVASKLNPAYLDQHCDRARTNEWRTNREAAAKLWSPYGQPGDRLWVRETLTRSRGFIQYAADTKTSRTPWPVPEWKQDPRPSIHMPRWASRLTLELTGVRVERVQEISEADARAEGCPYPAEWAGRYVDRDETARGWFTQTWNGINAKRGYGWDVNPWVWVLDFTRVEG